MRKKAAASIRITWIITAFLILTVLLLPADSDDPATNRIRFIFKSNILKESREIFVAIPESYHNSGKKYPLFIVLDGEDFFDMTAGMVSYYQKIGLMPGMILAGITSGDRWHDYTPTHADIPDSTPVPTSGGGSTFFSFIKDELVPHLGKKYRLTPFRLIFGHSIGGLFSVHQLITHPEYFSGAIATSPSLWWDDEITKKTFQKGTIQNRCRLFLCIGGEGPTMEDPIKNMVKAINSKKNTALQYKFQTFPGISHQTVPCHAMAAALEYIFKPWVITGKAMDSGLQAVEVHYRNLSLWMKNEIQIPERVLNRLGYMEMRKDNIPEAIRVFRLNVKLYPESANVYDSLGEALMKNGQNQEAVKCFKQALKIDPSLKNPQKMLKKLKENK